jgi:hypothetical protein
MSLVPGDSKLLDEALQLAKLFGAVLFAHIGQRQPAADRALTHGFIAEGCEAVADHEDDNAQPRVGNDGGAERVLTGAMVIAGVTVIARAPSRVVTAASGRIEVGGKA